MAGPGWPRAPRFRRPTEIPLALVFGEGHQTAGFSHRRNFFAAAMRRGGVSSAEGLPMFAGSAGNGRIFGGPAPDIRFRDAPDCRGGIRFLLVVSRIESAAINEFFLASSLPGKSHEPFLRKQPPSFAAHSPANAGGSRPPEKGGLIGGNFVPARNERKRPAGSPRVASGTGGWRINRRRFPRD